MASLSGKTALVTGASRGIGAAIARRLAGDGARVIGTVHRSVAAAQALASDDAIQFVNADLAEPDGAQRLADAIDGSIDILVNNAGIASFIPWGQNSAESIDREFAVNVRAPLLLTQALDQRIANDGRVIFLGSVVGQRAFADGALAAYAATKGALESLVRQLGGHFGKRNITVNAIAPGAIDTDMSSWIREEGGEAQVHSIQAIKRIGQPQDIAAAVAFLASDDGRWLTGQTLQVSGGTLL